MRPILIALLIFSSQFLLSQTQYPVVVMETTHGTMKIMLYDDTFRHSDNFIKLVNDGYYDGQLFHRVINNFMIQTGDHLSIDAQPGEYLGHGGKQYTIEAEIFPQYYHKKGAVAAARQGDRTNPDRRSAGSQFYIVQGQVYDTLVLDKFVKKGMHVPFTEEQKTIYTTIGGTPHLDYTYTVFGEVIEGLNIIDRITFVATDDKNRPLEDVKIFKMYTEK